ncbi:MAG: 6-bladed beta-propeller [Candidatus Aminicenantes bacterium]
MSKVWLCGIFLPIVLVFSLSCRKTGGYPAERSIADGSEFVMNPDFPRDKTAEATLEDSLIIGVQKSNEKPLFNRISDIVVDDAGRIYVLDIGDVQVKVFSSNGDLLFAFGSRGQGPGDLGYPGPIRLSPSGRVVINDMENRRIEIFSAEGSYIKEWKIEGSGYLIGVDRTGNIFMSKGTRWDRETGREERAFDRHDEAGALINRIASIEAVTGTRRVNVGRPGFTRTGYEHGAINYVLDEDGRLYLGCSSEYVFSLYDGNGKLMRKFGRRFKPIPVSAEDTKRIFGQRASEFESLMPKTKPPFRPLGIAVLEENGRLWVPTFEREAEGLTYDVFGTDGVYEDKVFIRAEPRKLNPLLFKAGSLYSIDIDDEGLQRVRRSRVVFN